MGELTFFFDRCTGVTVPKRLRNLRAPFSIEYHDEKKNGFALDEDDDAWLGVVTQKQWVVITHDKRFHNDSLAIQAVRQHGGRVFYLEGGASVMWDKLRRFTASYRRISQILKDMPGSFIYKVAYNDRVKAIPID